MKTSSVKIALSPLFHRPENSGQIASVNLTACLSVEFLIGCFNRADLCFNGAVPRHRFLLSYPLFRPTNAVLVGRGFNGAPQLTVSKAAKGIMIL